jgi:hypothetical protein
MRLSVLVPAVLLAFSAVACGSSNPNPVDPNQAAMQGQLGGQVGAGAGQYNPAGQYAPGQYGQQPQPGQYGQQPAQPGYGSYGQPAQPAPAQPAQPAPAQPAAGGGGSASPINASMLTPALTLLAQGEVQGMQAEGGSFAGNFQEGQTLAQPLALNPGRCYTVVGASAGIQQLDLQIVVQQPPFSPTIVSQSNTQGPQAVLGGKGACWKNLSPFPIPAKVIVKATRGAGMAAAQVYSK